jgi:carbon monoxide dehydrogenase subunit G
MEHESFVPTPSDRLAEAFRTPGTVASALPGWQPDADAPAAGRTATGRLRLRIAGSTITYRGSVTVEGDASPFTLEAHGTEVRGDGVVRVSARITLSGAELPEPGTTVAYEGSAKAEGRLAGYDPAVVEAAVRRLLDRFSAEVAAQAPAPPAAGAGTEPEPEPAAEAAEEAEAAEDPEATPPAEDEAREELQDEAEEEPDVVDDLGDPTPELGDFELVEVEVEVPESAAALDDLVPPAEAAHARRTMIGRSAEEVDHAPPRGRYAPEPAPDATSAAATLRWAVPAAAALLASAVVVGRVLRRRR